MTNELLVIQYGGVNQAPQFVLPDKISWKWVGNGETVTDTSCDVLILGCIPEENQMNSLAGIAAAYTVFSLIPEDRDSRNSWHQFWTGKKVTFLPEVTQEWIDALPFRYWRGQYGERKPLEHIVVNRGFRGSIHYSGHAWLTLEGNFGADYKPTAIWRYSSVLEAGRDLDLWLEYTASGEVRIRFCVKVCMGQSTDDIIETLSFDCPDEEMHIKATGKRCYLNYCLEVQGTGILNIGTLHVRQSRDGVGTFLAGGKRFADHDRQEFCSYYDPMDRKPPLNVYFSGYRQAEGFEGYYMMRNLGAPFLLFTDPRLEGGDFYLGSEEYEDAILAVIRRTIEELGFGSNDLIMSGISMGTTGALYYGAQLRPHAIIVGKPLINLGNIAANEKRIRPGGFPTSLDMLGTLTGAAVPKNVPALNQKVWDRIDSADWRRVKIAVAYMQQDDYDTTAYEDFLRHLETKDVRIYGKGILGRHNDNTNAVIEWLLSRYRSMLRSDYGRQV